MFATKLTAIINRQWLLLLSAFALLLPVNAQAGEKLFIQTTKLTGIQQEMADTFVSIIASSAGDFQQFEITTFSDLQAVLDLDQQKGLLGCDDNSCMIEIRNAIGARYAINSNISKFDGAYVINLSFIDTGDMKVISRVTATKIREVTGALQDNTVKLLKEATAQLGITGDQTVVKEKKQKDAVKESKEKKEKKAKPAPDLKIKEKLPDPHKPLKITAIVTGSVAGAALITAAISAGEASKARRYAESVTSHTYNFGNDIEELNFQINENRKLSKISFAMFAVGGAAAITSISTGIVYAKKHKQSKVTFSPVFDGNGAYLSLSGNW